MIKKLGIIAVILGFAGQLYGGYYVYDKFKLISEFQEIMIKTQKITKETIKTITKIIEVQKKEIERLKNIGRRWKR